MTVTATNPYVYYSATAAQTTFAIPFRVLQTADIKAYVNDIERSDYSLSASPPFNSANLIFNTGLTLNDKVAIVRNTELSQGADYSANYNFSEQDIENSFDKLTLMAQDFGRKISKAFGFKDSQNSSSGLAFQVPVIGDAGKVLVLNEDADEVVYSTTSLGDIDAAVADCEAARDLAQGYASDASTSADAAQVSNVSAGVQATAATAQKVLAQTAATLAQDWATKAEDSPVTTGPDKFSALHWAAKAYAFVAQCVTIANNLAATLTGNYILRSNPSESLGVFVVTNGMKADMDVGNIADFPTSGLDVTYEAILRNGTAGSFTAAGCKIRSTVYAIEANGITVAAGTDIIIDIEFSIYCFFSPAKNKIILEKIA